LWAGDEILGVGTRDCSGILLLDTLDCFSIQFGTKSKTFDLQADASCSLSIGGMIMIVNPARDALTAAALK
jgi:hypothetical protein